MRELKDRVLTEGELFRVLEDLTRRAKRSLESRQLLVIFRLAVCCGLRPCEIAGLKLRDVTLLGYPRMELCGTRLSDGKVTRRARIVSYGFDGPTQECIDKWRSFRMEQSRRKFDAPFICSLRQPTIGKPLSSKTLAKRWKACVRCLGPERTKQLSISAGRHSGIVQWLRRGFLLEEVKQFAGHASIAETAAYVKRIPGIQGAPFRKVFHR